MSDYSLLLSKIIAEHSGASDAEILVALNEKTIPQKKPIRTGDIEKYLLLNGLWLGIKTSANPAAVVTVDALLMFQEFNAHEPEVYAVLGQMMDGLIAANLTPAFTATHKAQILGMGDYLASWADLNWEGDIQLWQIKEVRS